MVSRTVKLLHIEDDQMQQQLTAQQLTLLPDLAFSITYADNEEAAVSEFAASRQEIILLDYHLAQGNGLSCLRKLRQLDPIVPIIALSGKASEEIAAELLKAGADNFLSKKALATADLTGCVQDALLRADAWRRHAPTATAPAGGDLRRAVHDLLSEFAASAGPHLLARLDAFEAVARQANLDLEQFRVMMDDVCQELASAAAAGAPPVRRVLRPLLLELVARLWGDRLPAEPPAVAPSPRAT